MCHHRLPPVNPWNGRGVRCSHQNLFSGQWKWSAHYKVDFWNLFSDLSLCVSQTPRLECWGYGMCLAPLLWTVLNWKRPAFMLYMSSTLLLPRKVTCRTNVLFWLSCNSHQWQVLHPVAALRRNMSEFILTSACFTHNSYIHLCDIYVCVSYQSRTVETDKGLTANFKDADKVFISLLFGCKAVS